MKKYLLLPLFFLAFNSVACDLDEDCDCNCHVVGAAMDDEDVMGDADFLRMEDEEAEDLA